MPRSPESIISGQRCTRDARSAVWLASAPPAVSAPSHCPTGEAKLFAEAADEVLFHLDGKRAMAPSCELGVQSRRQGIRKDAHSRRSRVEQSKVSGARGMNLVLYQGPGN